MALLKVIKARMEYVALMSTCGRQVGTAAHDSLLVDAMSAVLSSIRNCRSISTEDAIAAKVLLDGTLKPVQSNSVMGAVRLNVNVQVKTDEPKQMHYFIDCYCTEMMHAMFEEPNQTHHTKLMFMAG